MSLYQHLPDDVLLMVIEADYSTNGKRALSKWRRVNSRCNRLASRLLFNTQSFSFGDAKNTKSIESLQFLDANPEIARIVRRLTLRGFISTQDNDIPMLLRRVLSRMEKLEYLNWDLTVEEARLMNQRCNQKEVQLYTRTTPQDFWMPRPRTIVELFECVAILPNLKKLQLNMPWWEAATLKPLNTRAEIHLRTSGTGIYEWEPETNINMDNVFGPLTSLDITLLDYNNGNSYIHTLLKKSQNTLTHLSFRSKNGLDHPEKYTDLVFPKLQTLVWEVYNPSRFDRGSMTLGNNTGMNSPSVFHKSQAFLDSFLGRHPGIRSVKIVFNQPTLPGSNFECVAVHSCVRPFIAALGKLPKLENLQFVGMPVSWNAALSIAKQHTRLQALWLPLKLESLEEPFQYTPSKQKEAPYVRELRELISFMPQLKLLCLNSQKTWQIELSDAVSKVAKSSQLDLAAVCWASQKKSWYRYESNITWGNRISERLRRRSGLELMSDLQFCPRVPPPGGEWLDNPEWDHSAEFTSGLRDDITANSVFDISAAYRGSHSLSISHF